MVTSDGADWRTRRRLAQPHFRRQAIEAMSVRLAAVIDELDRRQIIDRQRRSREVVAVGFELRQIGN